MSKRKRQWLAFSLLAAAFVAYLLVRTQGGGRHDAKPPTPLHVQPTTPAGRGERPLDRDFREAMQQESRALNSDAGPQ
jgi:hypothetical protein